MMERVELYGRFRMLDDLGDIVACFRGESHQVVTSLGRTLLPAGARGTFRCLEKPPLCLLQPPALLHQRPVAEQRADSLTAVSGTYGEAESPLEPER